MKFFPDKMIKKRLDEMWDDLEGDIEKSKLYGQQYHRYKSILKELPIESRGKKVLEVGCGLGHLSICISKLGFDVYCVDFDINKPYKRWAKYNIRLYECDIEREDLPFADDMFDIILFTDILEHMMDDPRRPLKEMKRVLKKDGILILATPNVLYLPLIIYPIFGRNVFPIISEYYQKPYKTKIREIYDRHNRLYTMKEVIQILSGVGFLVKDKKFLSCGEPVLKLRGKLEYVHKFSIERIWDSDWLKKIFYCLITKIIPPWRSWIMVKAGK